MRDLREAIRIVVRDHAGEIRMLVIDIVMPEVNGRELAESLKPSYPDDHAHLPVKDRSKMC